MQIIKCAKSADSMRFRNKQLNNVGNEHFAVMFIINFLSNMKKIANQVKKMVA